MNEMIERKGTKYVVTYPEESPYEHIRIQYKGIDKYGYALATIWYGTHKVYREAKVNMLSSSALDKVAVACNNKAPGFEWGDIVGEANDLIRTTHDEGNEVINLKHGNIADTLQYHVDPFLIRNQHNLLYGDGGLGKSWFALYLASLVSTGTPHGKLYPEHSNVLYLDYEVDQQDMTNRFHALCEGLGVQAPDLHYRKQFVSVAKDEDRIRDIVAELAIGFVIIDSAAAACGGEPENASIAAQYWNSLSSLGCTTLTIAHVSKAEAHERGTSTPYGSVFWRNYARNAWEIKKNNTSNKLETHFGLTQTKINSGAGDRPRNFKFIFDNAKLATTVNVVETDVTENDNLMETGSATQQAIAVIEKSRSSFWANSNAKQFPGVTAQDCVEVYGKTANSYSLAFSRNPAIFVQVKKGYYDIKYIREEDERLFMKEPQQAVQFTDRV